MASYNNETSPAAEILISGVKGLAVGVLSATILLFAFSAIAYGGENPDSLTAPLGYAALYISSAISGAFAGRISGEHSGGAALAGASAGVMLMLTVILLSFIPAEAPAKALSPLASVGMYAAVPAAAALGGFALRKRVSRKVKHRRRR